MLQPGDKVWYGAKAVTDVYSDGAVDIESWDDNEIHTFDESVIPDVPNLPAIARFLAEHPETVDALHRFEQWVSDGFDNPTLDESIDPYGPMPEGQWDSDIAGIRSFVKAMRGEGGHGEAA